MGGTSYSTENRSFRAASAGYFTSSPDEIFKQNKKKVIHESMNPVGVTIREARDSDVHPNSIPIILALDLTGSMGHIPHLLIKDGLPKLIGGIIQAGIPDPALLFLGIGDHEVDDAPLQVAQFESGDAELDMWLERTYIESGGGGNAGESYSLAHWFAANICVTDNWEKRGKKGFLFTVGDEPNLRNYPASAMKEITGNGDVASFTDIEILEKAREKWHVFHILPGKETSGARSYWKQLLGDDLIILSNYEEVPDAIKDKVCSMVSVGEKSANVVKQEQKPDSPEKPFML